AATSFHHATRRTFIIRRGSGAGGEDHALRWVRVLQYTRFSSQLQAVRTQEGSARYGGPHRKHHGPHCPRED
ncbi:unnamed protein product, partial [Polarella glacialis]